MTNPTPSSPRTSTLFATLRVALAGAFLVGLTSAAVAEQRQRPPRKPPQEAFDACKSKARGDACTVTLRDHAITGQCDAPPDETQLACRPDHPPGPPPEVLEACTGKAEGDACSFTTPDDQTIAGTCAKGPNGEAQLGCRPSSPPPHH